MPAGEMILALIVGGAAVFWLGVWMLHQRARQSEQPVLEPIPTDIQPTSLSAPLVSILVPARNEAGRVLRQSIRSMLSQDYQNVEVIVVDDRSSDETLHILHQLSTEDPRLLVVEGKEPPNDWTGKPFALWQASQLAHGDWWLVADADLVLNPEAVGTALHLALQQACDAVFLIVRIECSSFWDRLLVPLTQFGVRMIYPLSRVNDPQDTCALAGTGLALLRRAAVTRTGGYAAIKHAVVDDLALAQLLKESGCRLYAAEAGKLARTKAHGRLADTWTAFGRGASVAPEFGIIPALAASLLGGWVTVLPSIVMAEAAFQFVVGNPVPVWPILLSTITYGTMVAVHMPVYRRAGVPTMYAWLAAPGYAVLVTRLLMSIWDSAWGRSLAWRERRLGGR